MPFGGGSRTEHGQGKARPLISYGSCAEVVARVQAAGLAVHVPAHPCQHPVEEDVTFAAAMHRYGLIRRRFTCASGHEIIAGRLPGLVVGDLRCRYCGGRVTAAGHHCPVVHETHGRCEACDAPCLETEKYCPVCEAKRCSQCRYLSGHARWCPRVKAKVAV